MLSSILKLRKLFTYRTDDEFDFIGTINLPYLSPNTVQIKGMLKDKCDINSWYRNNIKIKLVTDL